MDQSTTVRNRTHPKVIPEQEESENASAMSQGIKKSSSEDYAKIITDMNPRWKNWWIRGFFTIVLLAAFAGFIYFGPTGLVVLIILIQVKCYHEIISVGHQNYKKYDLPFFRTLSWYFLGTTNYIIFGEITGEYFSEFLQQKEILKFLVQRHRLISFSMYTVGIMLFVLSLRKNYYKVQFALFGWYQLTLLLILIPFYLTVQNVLAGLIWFFLPVSMVICNDIFAYIFGFFFGRTRLIKLSPKKTWEGFLGGFLATVLFSQALCKLMSPLPYFNCPPQFNSTTLIFTMDCTPSPTFQISRQFTLYPTVQMLFDSFPESMQKGFVSFLGLFGVYMKSCNTEVWMFPMIGHSFVLACFSSLIAPFGGFLASGFKRAFKIKDFGDTIPGHGGIMDRFDCQYLMMTFVNVYIASVVRAYNPNKLLHQVMFLEKEHQVLFYNKLQEYLISEGLL